MLDVILWLLAVELLGLLAFPILYALTPWLPDRGYTLAKPAGLLLAFYPLWLLASSPVFSNSLPTLLVVLLSLAVASGYMAWRLRVGLLGFLRREWRVVLLSELVFLGIFALWAVIKSHDAAINHTEQPMDFAFLNATVASRHFPPQDPWLAGHTVSYYYFGYLIFGGLTRLAGLSTSVGYNLALVLVAALAAVGIFGLAVNIVRLVGGSLRAAAVSGLLGVFLLLGIANLVSGLELIRAGGGGSAELWQWVDIKGLDGPLKSPNWYPTEPGWWWWRATRVIDTVQGGNSLDYTITEFPFFSFMLGDLHPHVMSLPFMLMFLGLVLNYVVSPARPGWRWLISWSGARDALVIVLALGALGFINLWDLPVFAALFAGAALAKAYKGQETLGRAAKSAIATAISVILLAVVLYLPFYLAFDSQAKGILPVKEYVTRPVHFLVVCGLFLLIVVPFVVWELLAMLPRGLGRWQTAAFALAVALVPWLIWTLAEGMMALVPWLDCVIYKGASPCTVPDIAGLVWQRFLHLLPLMLLAAAAVYVALRRLHGAAAAEPGPTSAPEHQSQGYTPSAASSFPLMLLALALFLLIGAELFYLVDIFNNRMNTIFKLYYQAWVLLAVVCSYAIYYLCSRYSGSGAWIRFPGYVWAGLVILGLVASVYYPLAAGYTKTSGLAGKATLDGLAYVANEDLGELQSIQWLKKNHQPGDVIVEAVGDDYSSYGRVSASTGIPTILGWVGHEHQWRGSTKPFEGRLQAVEMIYKTDDPQEAKEILHTYGVTYILVGPRERAKYGIQGMDKFNALGDVAFQEGDVVIYRVRK
ncbi:MAG: hypothetical protein EXR53_03675 [Dehalococcoidia bacterium]|nr:hypothetical protein [Dehalococcoidia bacterium]